MIGACNWQEFARRAASAAQAVKAPRVVNERWQFAAAKGNNSGFWITGLRSGENAAISLSDKLSA